MNGRLSWGERIVLAFACIGIVIAIFLVGVIACTPVHAEGIPRDALHYRSTVVREARQAWGLDAPVALFAAQLHQESGWKPQAVSRVGATGLAQFMPDAAKWWCASNKLTQAECQPTNPTWAIRALVGYDRWLFERVYGATEFDRSWAALRGYNGGLGHWQQEAATVRPATDRTAIDAACGHAKRHFAFCAENLGYPRRIMLGLQPLYAPWGREVSP